MPEMTRESLRDRLKPFTREWGTVHGNIEEVIDAILGGSQEVLRKKRRIISKKTLGDMAVFKY
jgi:hypothetical protein